MDDDQVPKLTTLDEHLSGEMLGKLEGVSRDKTEDGEEDGGRKVPITILTGKGFEDVYSFRIPWIWEDDVVELYS